MYYAGKQTFLCHGTAHTNESTIFISTDSGNTWEFFQRNAPRPNVKFVTQPGDGSLRVGNVYTTNAGTSWITVPQPDTLRGSDLAFFYLQNGEFVCRESGTGRWYRINLDEQRYGDAEIPWVIPEIYRLPNRGLLGIEPRIGKHVIRYLETGDTVFREVIYESVGGQVLDSIWVKNTIQIGNGMVVLIVQYPGIFGLSDRLLILRGGEAEEILAGEYDAEPEAEWHRLLGHHGDEFLVSTRNANRTTKLFEVNARTGDVRRVTPLGTSDQWNDWTMGVDAYNGTDVLWVDGNTGAYVMDVATGQIEMAGRVDDPHDRFTAVTSHDVVVDNGTVLWLDENGSVARLQNDSTSILQAHEATGIIRRDFGLERWNDSPPLVRDLDLTPRLLWSSDSSWFVGGEHLHEVVYGRRPHVVRDDTTSFWLRLSSGEELAGYRQVLKRTLDGFDTLGRPGQAEGAIGCMMETVNGDLLCGLRGYVVTINLEPSDTVRGGLHRSTNGGVTWSKVALPVDAEMVYSLQRRSTDNSLWASVGSVSRVLQAVEGNAGQDSIVAVQHVIGGTYLLRSNDDGFTWQVVNHHPANVRYSLCAGNVDFRGGRTITWVTHDRVHWSDDDGMSWRLVDGLEGLEIRITSAAFDTTGTLWIASNQGLHKVSTETVGGIDSEVNDPQSHSTPIFWANTFPNPTDQTFTLRLYNLDRLRGDVEQFEIVDLLGRTVLDLSYLTQGQRPPGTVDVPLDLGMNASGLYLLVARTTQRSFTWLMWVYHQ